MFSPRWSHFSLLISVSFVGLTAFWAGTRFVAASAIGSQEVKSVHASNVGADHRNTYASPLTTESVPQCNAESLEVRWSELSAKAGTPSVELEMAKVIEEMARNSPQRAISIADNQPNVRLRAALLRAALKGWSQVNPEAAVEWTESETIMDSAQALNAVFQGAAQDPDRAIALESALVKKHSDRTLELGNDLVSALTESGQFQKAANFAAGSTAGCREDWMLQAYSRWAEFQPQAAIDNIKQISDPILRDAAMSAVVVGWGPTDPQGLAEFAEANLSSTQKDIALSVALRFWGGTDPAGAANWINQNTPGAAFDEGIAEIAVSPTLAQSPDVAAGWAASIVNPQLRLEILKSVVERWAATDASGARNFIENSSLLHKGDRAQLFAQLQNPSAP